MLKKLMILSAFLMFFGGCGLLHLFPPSFNNALNQPGWQIMNSLTNVTQPAYYDIAVDQYNSISAGVFNTSGLNFVMFSAKEITDKWQTNYQFAASTVTSLKVKYNDHWGITFALMDGGLVQIKNYQSSNWANLGVGFNTTDKWDYYFDESDNIYALAQTNSTSFKVTINDNPDQAGNIWAAFQGFTKSTGFQILDFSSDVDPNGNVFVGVADPTNCRIYFNSDLGACIFNQITNGMEYAKVAVNGNGGLYLIYKSKENTLNAMFFEYKYPGMSAGVSIPLYDKIFFIDGLNAQYGLSVAADKHSTRIYVGFITLDNRKPMVIKIENGMAFPMPVFPAFLTNCRCIKLALNPNGQPAAGVLTANNKLHIFKQW